MVCPDADVFVFFNYLSADVELPCLCVEVNRGYEDGEVDVNPCARGRTCGGFGCYAADCGGAEDVSWGYEVVCVPLEGGVSLALSLHFHESNHACSRRVETNTAQAQAVMRRMGGQCDSYGSNVPCPQAPQGAARRCRCRHAQCWIS